MRRYELGKSRIITNMNDLVFNRMLATAVDNTKDVRGSLDQMGEVIEKVFHDVSIDTAERAWAHL